LHSTQRGRLHVDSTGSAARPGGAADCDHQQQRLRVVVGCGGRRRQSFWVHFWLFLLTAGIGNVLYAMHISRWNRDHGF
jgi:hypothetical protein